MLQQKEIRLRNWEIRKLRVKVVEIAGLEQVENVNAAVDLPWVLKGEDQLKAGRRDEEILHVTICRTLADKKEQGYF